ncbi:MAG: hypothetical protein V3S13_02840 [Candidatus Omnitrophota bacterium]
MDTMIPAILLLLSVGGLFIGIFLFFRPDLAIEIQRRFYEKINWRIEPISMPKEIRNTRIMGLFLVFISLVTTVYVFRGYLNG